MARIRKGYANEVADLGQLIKKLSKDVERPAAWVEATKTAAEGLARMLLAADHDPSFETTQANPKKPSPV